MSLADLHLYLAVADRHDVGTVVADIAMAAVAPPSVPMESVSWQTNCAVAEQSPCLFVQSARARQSFGKLTAGGKRRTDRA